MATAYTEPNTVLNPSTGNVLTAAWCDVIRDDLDAIYNPPIGHVYKSAVQSIGDASDTVFTFDSEYEDTDTLHSTVTNTGRFTATKAGWYEVRFNVSWASNSTGRRRVGLRKNGSALIYVSQNADSGGTTNQGQSWGVDLAATDYVDLIGYQNSGGALDATVQFQIVRDAGT